MADVPQYTTHTCSRCGSEVPGLHGNWYCPNCEAVSPHTPAEPAPQADRDPTPPPNRR